MKTCFKCGANKTLDQFYAHKQMADGRLNKCKECAKEDVRNTRADRVDYYREFDRKRNMKPARVRARKAYLKTPAGKAARAATIQRYQSKFPDKKKATMAVNNAVRDSRLIKKPCEECGAKKVEAHHANYSKPLEVLWLCNKHHRQQHVKKAV